MRKVGITRFAAADRDVRRPVQCLSPSASGNSLAWRL